MEEKIKQIPIDRIQASRYQPRIKFDEKALEELAQSIRQNGVIQPITVREVEDHYEIIAGERRWRASQIAGLKEVPVHVHYIADEAALDEEIRRVWHACRNQRRFLRRERRAEEEVAVVGKLVAGD